jgi:hypothetical protein
MLDVANSSPEPASRIFRCHLPISKSASSIEGNHERLEERKYDAILFRNGYAKDAPEMLVEFRGLRRHGKGHTAYYAIRLGRILKIRRWPKGRPSCRLHATNRNALLVWTVRSRG